MSEAAAPRHRGCRDIGDAAALVLNPGPIAGLRMGRVASRSPVGVILSGPARWPSRKTDIKVYVGRIVVISTALARKIATCVAELKRRYGIPT
jgi:hypothetical protein